MRNAPRYCLTMDTDWVPPFVLKDVLALLAATPVKATIFCTGDYACQRAQTGTQIEWGIHPNILAGSTHGHSAKACIDTAAAMTPKATASRTHSFAWCTGCPGWLKSNGITHDASIYRPGEPDLEPFFDNGSDGLIRIPSWWGDRAWLSRGGDPVRFNPPGLTHPGLKVILFHPIHIYLNNPDMDAWRQTFPDRALHSLTPEELAPFRRYGDGARTLFQAALEFLSGHETLCISSLEVPHA